MKAQDAESTPPTINGNGSIPKEAPIETNNGNIILAVAVLEVISVSKFTPATTNKVNIKGPKTFTAIKWEANHVAKSVWENPFAIAKPAPKISKTSQGKFLACFH